ncbi:MAG: response regulator transcription factor [Planctomycetaceae bacterium]|nr:response regulator transcription factor [Planctomycetaceae bacterium]
MTIRLLVADDHEIVRDGLRMTFENTRVRIVAEAVDGQHAFELLQQHEVDVALIDISMPRADGFQFLELVRQADIDVRALMHSVHDGSEYLRRCQKLGAKGFLLKGQEKTVLLAAVSAVHNGNEFWNGPSVH